MMGRQGKMLNNKVTKKRRRKLGELKVGAGSERG
jgi:hypothetical protein